MTLDEFVDEVVADASEDWLDLGWLVSMLMSLSGRPQGVCFRPAIDALRAMVDGGLVRVGDLGDGFSAWTIPEERVVDEVVARWRTAMVEHGEVGFGDPCWIDLTELGERRAREVLARDGGLGADSFEDELREPRDFAWSQPIPPNDWFGTVDVGEPARAPSEFLDELLAMLDACPPPQLDRVRSSIGASSSTHAGAIEIRLVHADAADAAVNVVATEREIVIGWLTAHRRFIVEPKPRRDTTWTFDAVDGVFAVLRGELEVEDVYRGDRLVTSRVVDVAKPDEPRVVSRTGSPLASLLPFGPRRVERRRVDFGLPRRRPE